MPGKKICNPQSGRFEICVAAGNQCGDDISTSVKDTCEGDTLVHCVDGYATKTDCKGLGFFGCDKLEINGNLLGAVCR